MRNNHASAEDWRCAAEFVADAALTESLDAFAQLTAERVRHLFQADVVVFNPMDRSGRMISYWMAPDMRRELDHLVPAFMAFWYEHPWATPGWFSDLVRDGRAALRSDLVAWRKFRGTGLWNEVYIQMRSKFQIAFGGPLDEHTDWGLGINRVGREFGPRERELAKFLQPRLVKLAVHAIHRERTASAASSLSGFFQQRDAAFALVAADASIVEISEAARALLARVVPGGMPSPAELPESCAELRSELSKKTGATPIGGRARPRFAVVPLAARTSALVLRLVDKGPALVIFQEEQCAGSGKVLPRLTRRESEIFAWLGEGKSNAEIAVLLGISARTVEKHCENLFAKLGVESRFAAALMARSNGPK